MEGPQRAGAGGVDDAIGAAEVQAVGDPAGGDVAQQAGERVLLPGRVAVADPLHDVVGGRLGDAGLGQRPSPDRVTQPGPQGDDQLLRAGDAHDDADPRAVEVAAGAVAGVVQGRPRGDEAEELGRVGGVEVVGANPEIQGREVDRVEEPALLDVGLVGRFGVGVVVVLGPPVRRGDVGDGVDAAADVGPVAGQAVGLGEQAAHADDRHGGCRGWIDRVQRGVPWGDGSGCDAGAFQSASRAWISAAGKGRRVGTPVGRAIPWPERQRARPRTDAP